MADEEADFTRLATKLDELSRACQESRAKWPPLAAGRLVEASKAAHRAARALREVQATMDRAAEAMDEEQS